MRASIFTALICCSITGAAQNIGIGTLAPTEKLHVNGNIRMDTAKANVLKITPNAGNGKLLTSDASGNASWQPGGNLLKPHNGLSIAGDTLNLGGRLFSTTNIALAQNEMNFSDIGSGVVSVANSVPSASNLSINGSTITQTFVPASSCQLSAVQLNITALSGASITLEVKDDAGRVLGTATKTYPALVNGLDPFLFNIYLDNTRTYTLSVTGNANAFLNYDLSSNAYPRGTSSIGPNADLSFNVVGSGEERLLSLTNNRVGIGTSTPVEKLDVNGNVRADNLIATKSIQLTNNAGAGKVLTSGPAGEGNWANSNSVPGSIAAINNRYGSIASAVPGVASIWVFFGPFTSVTLNGNQRVLINAVAGLGKTVAGNSPFRLDVGYQLQPSGEITNAAAGSYIRYQPNLSVTDRQNFAITGSFKPVAGTYKIGLLIYCTTVNYLDFNDWANFSYMIINE
ncbi:MAG: hypothetical protein ABIX01_12925 [Chitinophagaceae bacterium]